MSELMLRMIRTFYIFFFVFLANVAFGQHDKGHGHDHHDHGTHEVIHDEHDGHHHSHDGHDHNHDHKHDNHVGHDDHGCGGGHGHGEFSPGDVALHHISDANVYSIGPWMFPLPVILHDENGFHTFMSSAFQFDKVGHGDGKKSHEGYVLDGGMVKRIKDKKFHSEDLDINGFVHRKEDVNGKQKFMSYACLGDKMVALEDKSTLDGGVFGGGLTSFKDYSITKNVVTMFLVFAFMAFLFLGIAKKYRRNPDVAPNGAQGLLEPIIVFIRDEVAQPFIGHDWAKYFPFLLSLFFFILGLNLFGQIPFFGNSNVTGNLAFTMALAIFAFFVTNLSGKKDYWMHILWPPGVPFAVKLILIPVEILGIFIKPLTLMLRLFANITAGHIVMVVFVGLIFIFGKSGESIPGTGAGIFASGLLTIFMMALELLVAFIQAFVFTILTASYIGAAVEEHH